MTARGLAFLIMDDGGKSVHNQTILHTRSFSPSSVLGRTGLRSRKQDVEYLGLVLNKNFGLRTRLEEKKPNQ